ncbi:MAG: DUF2142 domain-containing protein [Solirubrobacteraceae bacterium]
MVVAVQRGSAPAAPRRGLVPRGLGVLLVLVTIIGVAWALLVPPWQTPDELNHFAYAQSLAESFTLPGAPGRLPVSADISFADGAVGAGRGAFFPRFSPPVWSRAAAAEYAARESGSDPLSRTNGGGATNASTNPPLYYLFAAIGTWIDHGGTAFGRLYTTRLLGVVLLLLTTTAAWLLAGEVFARRRLAQLLCAATVGLLPMATFMSTSVNPDALLMTTWTFALWLGARVINRAAQRVDAVALCAVTAAAILVKATSYALVAPALLALLLGWRRRPREERRHAAGHLTLAVGVLLAPVLAWVALAPGLGGTTLTSVSSGGHAFNVRQFLSYVWQFYLPRLPFLTPLQTWPDLAVWHVWLRGGLGTFGWLDVSLAPWIYAVAGIAIGGIGVAVVILLVRRRSPGAGALLAFFALCLVALLGLLHITEYRVLIGGGGPFLQGRYLLPLVSLFGLAVGLVGGHLPIRVRAPAAVLVLVVLLTLQVASLGAVAQAYYL